MAVRERNKVFELVTLKGDSRGQQKRSNVYQDITPETLPQPQKYEDSTLRRFESESEQTNRSVETLEDYNNKNTSIYKKTVTFMIVLAVILIIASLIFVFSLAIFNSLTSTEFKAFSATEFQVMMEHIDQVNLSVSLLNKFYELKSSKQQEHLLNLTAQNKEMMKTLENLNNSLSRRLLSQTSKIQNWSTLTVQNKENISAEISGVKSEIKTVKGSINQLRSNVTSEIKTVNGNIGQLRNSYSVLRNSLNEVQTIANRADTRTTSLAGEQVLVNCSTKRLQNSLSLVRNQKRTISVVHTTPSVSYNKMKNGF